MPLYDVGMTSLLVSEAESLAELALVAFDPPRTEDAVMLRARCDDMRSRMREHLWHPDLHTFVNKFSTNGSFYPRISPT